MRSRVHVWLCVCGLLLVYASGRARAQGQAVSPATEAALHDMAQLAGVIFTGEVVAVRRNNGGDGSSGVVEIEFAVDDAVRGVSGGSYTLREWAGPWNAGEEPFRVGQHFLMLLHTPGASGLSSPVGGMDGAVPIRDRTTVDLRWIATGVVQPIAYRPASVARPTASPVSARADSGATSPALIPTSSPQGAKYAAVLAMLRSWEKEDAPAR